VGKRSTSRWMHLRACRMPESLPIGRNPPISEGRGAEFGVNRPRKYNPPRRSAGDPRECPAAALSSAAACGLIVRKCESRVMKTSVARGAIPLVIPRRLTKLPLPVARCEKRRRDKIRRAFVLNASRPPAFIWSFVASRNRGPGGACALPADEVAGSARARVRDGPRASRGAMNLTMFYAWTRVSSLGSDDLAD